MFSELELLAVKGNRALSGVDDCFPYAYICCSSKMPNAGIASRQYDIPVRHINVTTVSSFPHERFELTRDMTPISPIISSSLHLVETSWRFLAGNTIEAINSGIGKQKTKEVFSYSCSAVPSAVMRHFCTLPAQDNVCFSQTARDGRSKSSPPRARVTTKLEHGILE